MNLTAISEADWQNLYAKLYAFAHFPLNCQPWFRRTVDHSYLEGKTSDDFVMEAVTRYLEHPEKYDSSKRTLTGYLKQHIIRSLIGNDVVAEENTTSVDGVSRHLTSGGDYIDTLECMLPHAGALFDEELDYQLIIQEIRDGVAQDPPARIIFEAGRSTHLLQFGTNPVC